MRSANDGGKVPVMPPESEPYNLSPRDAAALIGCHEDTLKRWAADHEIAAIKTPGGWWKFRRSDVDAFLIDRGNAGPATAGDAA